MISFAVEHTAKNIGVGLPNIMKKKKMPHRPKPVARELIPCRHFEPARVKHHGSGKTSTFLSLKGPGFICA